MRALPPHRLNATAGTVSLLASLLLAAACGAGAVSPPIPPAPLPSATPSAASSAAPAASVVPSATAALAPTAPRVEMKTPVPTALVAELDALGLDARDLPPIEKLDPRALRGVMKLMARSLGLKCSDCHAEGDFAAPTPRKHIATRMWNEWAAKMTLNDAPLFCDSCHQGRIKLLDRSDKTALSRWMADNFVSLLKLKDAQPTQCETCHVHMDMHFLSTWSVSK